MRHTLALPLMHLFSHTFVQYFYIGDVLFTSLTLRSIQIILQKKHVQIVYFISQQ